MDIEARLAALGLTLPPPVVIAPHIRLPFAFVRVSGIARTFPVMRRWIRTGASLVR